MAVPARAPTRAKVRLAAAEVFAERGYAGAGMAEIVLRSGMTRGAVYFHFDSKAELAQSLVDQARSDWAEALARVDALGEQGLPGVGLVFEALGELLARDVVSRAAVRLEHETDQLPSGLVSPVDRLRDDVARRLRQAQLAGRVHDDVDPVRHAAILVASFLGLHEHGWHRAHPSRRAARFRSEAAVRVSAWWELTSRGLSRPS